MKNCLIFCLIIFVIFASNELCFGNETKDHICFRVIDTDKDGAVTFQEFREVFGDDRAKYDKIDLNGDGKLSHEEYHQSLGHGAS